MKFNPHDYQKYAIEYIKNNPIAAVLLDMGLGKTVITLTAINDLLNDSFEVSKILIIAPLRVAKTTWSDEIRKWEHLHFLRYYVAVGTEQQGFYINNNGGLSFYPKDGGSQALILPKGTWLVTASVSGAN